MMLDKYTELLYHQIRHRGDSSPCGQRPMDFESISLATRTQCLACRKHPARPEAPAANTVVAEALNICRHPSTNASYIAMPHHWVHSSVVRAADCRSAGPWFKSGCALLFAFCFCPALFDAIACSVLFAANALRSKTKKQVAQTASALHVVGRRCAAPGRREFNRHAHNAQLSLKHATGKPNHTTTTMPTRTPDKQTKIKTLQGPTRHSFAE